MADAGATRRGGFLTAPFLVLCSFYFLVFAAGYQLFPVVPLRLREFGASLAESGRFQTAFMLGSGFGSLCTGPLGDRLGQRRVLRVASLAVVVILVTYALLKVRWVFYLLAPVHGLLWSALRTASVAKVGTILPLEHRAQGLSLFGLTGPGGVAVGPLVGLWLMPHLGFMWMLILLAGVFALLHGIIGALPREAPREIESKALFQWPDRAVWGTVAVMTLVGLGFGPMPPYSAQEAKAIGMAWPATFLTCFALGMMAIRGLLALTGMGKRPVRLLPYMIALASAGYALLAFMPGGMARHLLSGLIYGAGYGMVHTLLLMNIFATTPPERTGAAVGALFFAFDAATAFGALGLGWVMEHLNFRHGWAIGAALMALSIPVARRIVRKSTAMTTEPDRLWHSGRMSTQQERSATLATMRHRRIGPAAKQTAPKGRAPLARVKPKPEREAGAERHRTFVRPRRGEAQDGPNEGCGTGRLRLGKRSAPEHAPRALGGGAA